MNWRQALNFALSSCGALVLMMGIFTIGPEIETRFWPVYSKFEIVSIEPYGKDQSLATFRYNKLRQCAPQGFAWYAGELGGAFRQLTVKTETPTTGTVRPLGLQLSSPYVIDAKPETIRSAVFAELYSRCWPLWTTRSVIYP